MAIKQVPVPNHVWYTAQLSPMAKGLFTDSFYPETENGSQNVYFTQVDVTPQSRKVIAVSKMSESGIRMMTLELARNCLVPGVKASDKKMTELNTLTCKLKL